MTSLPSPMATVINNNWHAHYLSLSTKTSFTNEMQNYIFKKKRSQSNFKDSCCSVFSHEALAYVEVGEGETLPLCSYFLRRGWSQNLQSVLSQLFSKFIFSFTNLCRVTVWRVLIQTICIPTYCILCEGTTIRHSSGEAPVGKCSVGESVMFFIKSKVRGG